MGDSWPEAHGEELIDQHRVHKVHVSPIFLHGGIKAHQVQLTRSQRLHEVHVAEVLLNNGIELGQPNLMIPLRASCRRGSIMPLARSKPPAGAERRRNVQPACVAVILDGHSAGCEVFPGFRHR